MKLIFTACLLITPLQSLHAESEEDINQRALGQTQKMLMDKNQRREAVQKGGSAAQTADTNAANLAGNSQNLDEMYEIASKVMPELVKQTNGDPEKMQALLERLQRDPASFDKLLTPDARKQLHDLAGKIEKAPTQPRH